jgi:hypothetical protein
MTLLELVIASALMTTVVTAAAMLLRGVHSAWLAHEGDSELVEAGHAAVRHIVRKVRQAQSVSAITASGDAAGSLSVVDPGGATIVWARNAGNNEVNFGTGTADQLLAEGIAELRFIGYKADGATVTAVPAEIQAVRCQVRIDLPRDTGGSRTIASLAWLRSW